MIEEIESAEEPLVGLDLEAFLMDEKGEKDGVYHQIAEDVELLVARHQNVNYIEMLAKWYKANRVMIDAALLSDNAADGKMCEVLARTIWLGWRGELRIGSVVQKDDAETRKKLLQKLPELRRRVVELSQLTEAYRLEELETVGESSSAG